MTLAQSLPFVHPAVAAAALATGLIPIVIHLLNRRRHARVPWAAMRFLLAATRRSAKRVRIEQLLLMAARVALIVLLGFTVARPFVPASAWIPAASTGVHRIILLDNSLSMSARRADGRTRFSAAKDCASELLNRFPASDPVSLITLASPAERAIGQASYDRRLAKDQLAALQPSQRTTDLTGGLLAALDIAKESRTAAGNQAVYVISDFPRSLLLPETQKPGEEPRAGSPELTDAAAALRRLAESLASPADLVLLYADGSSGANVALTDLQADAHSFTRDIPVRLSASVTNFGDSVLSSATVQFHFDGRPVRREPVPPVGPGESATVFTSILLNEPETHGLEARLAADRGNSLSEDDVRFLSVHVREGTRVLLVDGRPGLMPLDGECGFLATALSPQLVSAAPVPGRLTAPGDTAVTTKLTSPREIGTEGLGSVDVVALCNVPRLTSDEWGQLAGFVERGGGLLVSLGGAVNTDNYNRFGHAEGKGVVPCNLGQVIDADRQPAAGSNAAPRAFAIRAEELTHAVAARFRDQPASGLFLARTSRYVAVAPDPLRSQVALRFSSGDAALLASDFGKGRVLVWTTTANMDWTNLPAKGDYVSLMLSSLSYLTGGRDAGRNLLVGQTLREPLSAVQSALDLRAFGADGATLETTLAPREGGLSLDVGPIDAAGLNTLWIGPGVRRFAVNVDSTESDLAAADPDRIAAAIGTPLAWHSCEDAAHVLKDARHSTELAGLSLYAATLLLLCELWLGMHFGDPHGGRK